MKGNMHLNKQIKIKNLLFDKKSCDSLQRVVDKLTYERFSDTRRAFVNRQLDKFFLYKYKRKFMLEHKYVFWQNYKIFLTKYHLFVRRKYLYTTHFFNFIVSSPVMYRSCQEQPLKFFEIFSKFDAKYLWYNMFFKNKFFWKKEIFFKPTLPFKKGSDLFVFGDFNLTPEDSIVSSVCDKKYDPFFEEFLSVTNIFDFKSKFNFFLFFNLVLFQNLEIYRINQLVFINFFLKIN